MLQSCHNIINFLCDPWLWVTVCFFLRFMVAFCFSCWKKINKLLRVYSSFFCFSMRMLHGNSILPRDDPREPSPLWTVVLQAWCTAATMDFLHHTVVLEPFFPHSWLSSLLFLLESFLYFAKEIFWGPICLKMYFSFPLD